jgi:hypothetical protein
MTIRERVGLGSGSIVALDKELGLVTEVLVAEGAHGRRRGP